MARNRNNELKKIEKAIKNDDSLKDITVLWNESQDNQVYQWLNCQDGKIISGSRDEFLNAGNVIIEVTMDNQDHVHSKYVTKWSDNANKL